MEINLSLAELEAILEAERKRQYNQNKFMAALKGIDLEADAAQSAQERVDAIKNRVAAKMAGMDPDSYELSQMGLGIEQE
jgi:hypothetical protein